MTPIGQFFLLLAILIPIINILRKRIKAVERSQALNNKHTTRKEGPGENPADPLHRSEGDD